MYKWESSSVHNKKLTLKKEERNGFEKYEIQRSKVKEKQIFLEFLTELQAFVSAVCVNFIIC